MAAFLPHLVSCACGATFVVDAAESLNVRRLPKVRDDILASKLHRATCPECGVEATVEKDFFYADPQRHFFCKVQPRGNRHRWSDEVKALDESVARMPDAMSPKSARSLRVVFGMDELREKLVGQDAGLDDRHVELLKVFIVHEHPILLDRPRLRLRLDQQSPEELVFVAAYEHDPHRFVIRLPLDVARTVGRHSEAIREWAQRAYGENTPSGAGAQWVNLWKWSPQTSALCELVALTRQIRAHETVDLRTTHVTWMLEHIPRGSHLPDWAKKDLAELFKLSREKGWQQVDKAIFDVRFDTKLSSDWATNRDRKDIVTLWHLFRTLPSNNVEGNAKINEIEYGRGSASTYDPKSRDIFIASGNARSHRDFESTVRHEVGHAVHEKIKPAVDAWLNKRFGWATFDATKDDQIDKWIELMGGWRGIDSSQRRDVRRQLKLAVGARQGCWTAGKLAPLAPRNHPWNQEGFGPRLALEGSGDAVKNLYWYDCYKKWYRHGSQRFCCNFWYGELMAVPTRTLDIVTSIHSSYASMSPPEFFAEMYSVFYGSDHRRRSAFPADVQAWLTKNVG